MAFRLRADAVAAASWWCGRFDLMHHLECPSTRLDPTIERLPRHTLRQHPDLCAFITDAGLAPFHVLSYQALADGHYGMVRLAALFVANPFTGGHPKVFALDGDRRSLHRNPPWDNDVEGVSADLCLYFPGDPHERRWTAEYGLIELFDIARRHLACEHVWRETGIWPTDDALHGGGARPVRSQPALKVPPLRNRPNEVRR